jgi:hypothetical protein
MYGFMLQDWVTIQSAASIPNVVQTDDGWTSFQQYADMTFFVETSAILLGGATNLSLVLESSPTRDEALFTSIATINPLAVGLTTAASLVNGAVPIGRWVRWRLNATTTPATTWGATFRINCGANAVGRGA